MPRMRHTSPPPPLPSNTKRSRQSFYDEDLDDNLRMIPDNYNDGRDEYSKSHDQPLRWPYTNAMIKRPSKDSFSSTPGKHVLATQLTPTSALPLHPECREVYIIPEEENECNHAPLVSKLVSDQASEWLNPLANVYIYYRNDSNKAGKRLVEWKAGNQWRNEPFVDDVIGLIVCAEYNSQTTI